MCLRLLGEQLVRHSRVGTAMDADLATLQERCRKDPGSYREEYYAQQSHYLSLLSAATLHPADAPARLPAVASFVASTAPLYGRQAAIAVAQPTIKLLSEASGSLQPAARRALVRTLALLRARGAADAKDVIPLFFRLLQCEDKTLRRMLRGHILGDVKRMQTSGDAGKRSLQAFLYGMVAEPNEVLVKRSLMVLIDLFRRRIWRDDKTVNVIGSCIFHDKSSVSLISAKFLLDSESKRSAEDSENSDDEDICDDATDGVGTKFGQQSRDSRKASDMWKAYNMTGKKSSRKKRAMEKMINRATRAKKSANSATRQDNPSSPAFAAMLLLHDPQDFAERLYSDLQKRRRNEPYENRLVWINLLTRLVGTHKLFVLNLYPFLQRYLQPAQPEVTRVLAYLVQGCHELIPPDVLHPTVRALADDFVSEKSSPQSMAAGINTVRAICTRVPLAILDAENEGKPEDEQEAPLLEDLVQYKDDRDKGVVIAARSLMALYREVHPKLLRKKDRGRFAAEAVQKGIVEPAPAYGMTKYAVGVEGVELLYDSDSDKNGLSGENEQHMPESVCDSDGASELEERPICCEDISSKKDRAERHDSTHSDDDDVVDDDDDNDDDDDDECKENNEGKHVGPSGVGSDSVDDVESAASGDGVGSQTNDDGSELDVEQSRVSNARPSHGKSSNGKLRVDHMRILDDEDYARIRAREAARLVETHGKHPRPSTRNVDTGDAIDPGDIQGLVKRERRTLEERMESVLAGREGREKFGSRKGKNKGGGSSNKAKSKSKANSMIIHKKRRKSKLSRREVQQMKKNNNKKHRRR